MINQFTLFIGLLLLPLPGIAQIHFQNQAEQLGIVALKTDFSIGNGVSFVDFNQDGWDDLTIGTPKGKFIDFYQNQGGTFKRIFPLVTHRDESKQIIWVDFDNDNDLDLFVATYDGPNRLYENKGDLQFEDITEQSGLPLQDEYTYGAVWGDYNRDGWLDLYFGSHKDVTPDKYNKLFRNEGNKTFTDVSQATQSADLNKVPFCSGFIDVNNDQWPDIYTANDKLTYNTLLVNNRRGEFLSVGDLTHSDLRMNAMCVNMGDFNNDGWQDIYVTNTPIGNKLLRNDGLQAASILPTFTEIAEAAGVGYYGHSWASNFLDADNDGDLDLYVSGTMKISSMANRTSLFYENLGDGTFRTPDVGMAADSARSFVNAIGDVNQDGYPDIAVQNNPPNYHHCWVNSGGNLNWIKVKLKGVKSNRDAVGARVEVYCDSLYQMQYRNCGNGFMGQNTQTLLFGCNRFEQADSLVITWPTGHVDRFYNLATNDSYFIEEGQSSDGQIWVSPEVQVTVSNLKRILKEAEPLIIYPIPAIDQIKIPSSSDPIKESWLINQNGQFISTQTIRNANAWNIEELPAGAYWLLLQRKSGRYQVGKLIKH